MKSLLARYGLALALIGLYLYPFPYYPQIRSANELPRIYLTRAMAKEGTFAIDSGVRRWGSTADVSRARGHYYSNKAPGSSFLAVPGYLVLAAIKNIQGQDEPSLAEMFWVSRVTTGVLPTLLFLWLLSRFLRRFSGPDGVRMAVIGYGLGSMAMTYSILFIAHQLSAVCIGTAYILSVWVIEDDREPGWMGVAGFAAGCAPLVDYQAAFAGVPVAVYVVAKLLAGRRWRPLVYAALGAVGPVALLLYYHQAAFGSPFKTGYDFSQTFAHFHQQGFLGMTELRWEAFVGSTVAPDNGLLVLCPMLLLMLPGWFLMARRQAKGRVGRGLGWHLGITAAVVVIYLLFISSINFWRGGWQLGPRYITAMLPFAMVPVAVFFDHASGNSGDDARRRWPLRALAVALVTVGVIVYGLSSVAFPHFPEVFGNPLYEVTLRLLGDGLAPYSLGWALGLSGWASLVPYFALLAAVVAHMALPEPGRWRSAAVGLAGAALIIAAYSQFPGGGPRADQTYQRITTMMPR